VVSAEGRVWTFGWGWNSCLGHNDEQSRLLPTLLAEEVFKGSKIVTVAAGGYHTIVGERSAVGVGQGILWPAGPGRHQQQKRCGRGARDPTASWAWATPTTEALWAWGKGSYCQLGLGDTNNRSAPPLLKSRLI